MDTRDGGHAILVAARGRARISKSRATNYYKTQKREVGKCKQKASHAVRDVLPGSIWSEGGKFEPIKDLEHFHNTYDYIRNKQEAGAVVWSHRADENWIDDPTIGIVVMGFRRKKIRVFAAAQTPGV